MSLGMAGVGLLLLGLAGSACHHATPRPPVRPPTPSMERSGSVGHFGLGRLPTEEEIAAWDLDVRPDGQGLPDGSGTVEEGRRLYASRCAHCHGADGEGGPFDALVGHLPEGGFPFALDPRARRTIGTYWPWATTLFDYTRRAMPQDRPGSLDDDEVYALTAYLLHRNGLLPADAILDRNRLPGIVMPARDRFVPDDRKGGPEFR